ncbi:MAG: hypothetical protein PHE33_07580 [Bacteroidales bacterium]|nr:hypothetical protein [Bacteroidales bacterium]
MIQLDSYVLASYYALIIISDVDEEIHKSEIDLIKQFTKETNSAKFFDADYEALTILGYSREVRKNEIFPICVKYINDNANADFIFRFYSYAIELVCADGIVKTSELELVFMMRDVFKLNQVDVSFKVPKEIDSIAKLALTNCQSFNNFETFSLKNFASVRIKFETLDGILVHEISYDGTKTHYLSADKKLQVEMDKIRTIARGVANDLIHEGIFGSKDSLFNYRFVFEISKKNYFVIADFFSNRPYLSYVGCEEWDYHIK